jgi:hypothetical protein
MNEKWLVFTGDDIKKYLIKNESSIGYAETLNVSPATFSRWACGLARPSGPAIPILAMLLRKRKTNALQPQPPQWWRVDGQRKRREPHEPTSTLLKKASKRKQDIFQFTRASQGVFKIAISPRGLDEAETLAKALRESLKSVENARPKQQLAKSYKGHFLGLQDHQFTGI